MCFHVQYVCGMTKATTTLNLSCIIIHGLVEAEQQQQSRIEKTPCVSWFDIPAQPQTIRMQAVNNKWC